MVLLLWFVAKWRLAVRRVRREEAVRLSVEIYDHRRFVDRTDYSSMLPGYLHGNAAAVSWWGEGDRV